MQERYDTIEDAIFNLTCSQKLTWFSLIYHMEPENKKWRKEKATMDSEEL